MKQKAAIEKTYAEGLLKLSSVYGSKKIASKVALGSDTGGSGDATDSNSQTVFQLWLKVLDENEKVANLRLAAAQVFQEKISDEAKNLRTMKVVKARKFVDRYTLCCEYLLSSHLSGQAGGGAEGGPGERHGAGQGEVRVLHRGERVHQDRREGGGGAAHRQGKEEGHDEYVQVTDCSGAAGGEAQCQAGGAQYQVNR